MKKNVLRCRNLDLWWQNMDYGDVKNHGNCKTEVFDISSSHPLKFWGCLKKVEFCKNFLKIEGDLGVAPKICTAKKGWNIVTRTVWAIDLVLVSNDSENIVSYMLSEHYLGLSITETQLFENNRLLIYRIYLNASSLWTKLL